MIVYAIAALEALFYVLCVPVHVALRCNGLRFASGLSIFDRRAARRRAIRNLTRRKPRHRQGGIAWRTLSRLRFHRVALSGTLALGDAALTALSIGGLYALIGSLSSRAEHVRLNVRPDLASDQFHLELRGMLTLRAGQIILAVLPTVRKGDKA